MRVVDRKGFCCSVRVNEQLTSLVDRKVLYKLQFGKALTSVLKVWEDRRIFCLYSSKIMSFQSVCCL